jgi:nucleoside-diphosphate-sugar epimerase
LARVLITGAAGIVGSALWQGLRATHELRGIDRRRSGELGIRRGNVRRYRSIADAFEGVDAVVDLASGATTEIGWSQVWKDVGGRVNVLEAARRHGVPRYIFASSNHVIGLYERDEPYASIVAGAYEGLDPRAIPLLSEAVPLRPDSPYAVGKVAAEANARYFAEEFGISSLCLRIGTVNRENRPRNARHFATLLSHGDLVQLVECAIAAPPTLAYGVYYGVSANTWRFWDLTNARAEIGFEPHDDAERFRVAPGEASGEGETAH